MYINNTFKSYNDLGAHIIKDENGNIKTRFRLYAPNCNLVYLIIRNYKKVEMIKDYHGTFEIVLDENLQGSSYYYELNFGHYSVTKADPYGFFTGYRPDHDSIVYDVFNDYKWEDQEHLKQRANQDSYKKPMLVYEMHLGSWIKRYNEFHNYRTIADVLIPYLKAHSYTHVELMPIMEHPLDDSWGYQLVGFFSPTSRYGNPTDFKYFIDQLHKAGISVILDIVIGHINKDSYSLFKFDGSYMLEFDDEFRRENHEWGTANIDFSKQFSTTFFSSVIDYWISVFHVDGFRIDAVSKIFYNLGNKDYGYNDSGIWFIRHITQYCKIEHPHVLFFAEDSTAFPKVTEKAGPNSDGVGFDYKWDMGFMNDTLDFYEENDEYRKWHPQKITFSHFYFYSEKFILPFSHDEVVYGKKSLLNKMNSSYDLNFLKLQNLMTYFFTFPGKKLLFQGQEFAQFDEWNFKKELDWNLLEFDKHKKFNNFFKDLARVYVSSPELWERDFEPEAFKWSIIDETNSVFAYKRYSKDSHVICIFNMLEREIVMKLGVEDKYDYDVVMDTYNKKYFMNNAKKEVKAFKGKLFEYNHYLKFKLKPYQAMILKLKK